MDKKRLPVGTVLDKMQRYCAYQERCLYDVKNKLNTYDLLPKDRAWVIDTLIDDKFIDDSRFAHSFVRGKNSIKSWGRVRIEQELKSRGIPSSIIQEALQEINEDDYKERFIHLAQEKIEKVGGIDSYDKKARVYNYLYAKGYESSMIMDFLSVK